MADETPPAADDAAPAPSKPKRSYLTAIVIAIGLVAGGGFGTFVGGPRLANRKAKAAKSASEAPAAGEHAEKGKEGEKSAGPSVVLLDNLVLNPAGSGGLRFLLVTVGLQLSGGVSSEAVKSRDAEVRDVVLRVFGTKRVDELSDIAMRDGFKREITAKLDALLGAHSVKGVYFPQFVIQ